MSVGRLYRCDGPNCAAQKGETNHWYLVSINDYGEFVVGAWDAETAECKGIRLVCGQNCAQKLLGLYLDGELKKET